MTKRKINYFVLIFIIVSVMFFLRWYKVGYTSGYTDAGQMCIEKIKEAYK